MAVKASVTITISKYRDTDSITRYYKLQASTAAAPAVPTTLTPSGWSTSEPTYTSGSTNTLYYTDCIVFSDGTFQYTDDGNGKAVKSSSYEAAKEAYNKAQAAQDSANTTQENLDNLEIGGRNLLLNTNFSKNDISKYEKESCTLSIVNDDTYGKCLKAVFTAAKRFYYNTNNVWIDGQKYGISFMIKTDDEDVTIRPSRSISDYADITMNVTLDWQRYTGIINCRQTIDGGTLSFSVNKACTIYITLIKLEKGNKCTDWTPAPEDVEDQISNINQYISTKDIIVGTQTATTRFWTGVSQLESLHDGDEIIYWLPYATKAENGSDDKVTGVDMRVDSNTTKPAGTKINSWENTTTSSANSRVWLNLTLKDGVTKTGWIPCYYGGTTRLTTHYGAGNCIRLVYRINANINGVQYTGWFGDANYVDGNTNYYDRIRFQNAITAKTAITAETLNVGDSSGFFKLVAGSVFHIDKPILWAGSAIAVNKTGTNNYIMYSTVNLTKNIAGLVLTNKETVYLKGDLNGNVFTVDSDAPFTTTKPITEDNKYYISLGIMYSTTNCGLFPEHPIFKYVDGQFKNISQIAYEAFENNANLQLDYSYFKETTFTTYQRQQELNDQGIKNRLSRTEVTVYGDPENPDDPEALINHIQQVDNDINGSGGLDDRLEAAEGTIDGTGLNDYDQRVKITQRFLNVETDVESIKNMFKVTGGTNLVQNSVGYFADGNNKPTMWNIAANTIYTPFGYDGDLTGITVSRGRLFCAKGSVITTSNNMVALLANKMMSISFKYKNGANATSKIKVFNGSIVYFEKTFNTAVDQWTEYTFNPDTDPVLANPSFLNTANSLQISIESTNSTNNNGFEISDLMLNYGDIKPWELSNNEVYGAMVKLSSLGIEVTATTAHTKNFMTTDGILVYEYNPQTDLIGNLITKITDEGTETNKLTSTGDIIERNLIHTMIKDSSNNDVYVEYIR